MGKAKKKAGFGKKAQSAGGVAGFLAFLAAFVVLYMMVIPPDLREELLGEGGSSGSKDPNTDTPYSFAYDKTIMQESPGRIDYLKFSEYEHPLPAVNLYSTSAPNQREIGSSMYVKNGIFDQKQFETQFSIDSPENIENAFMSFSLNQNRNNRGWLSITLNGKRIYNREIKGQTPDPIGLQAADLRKDNTMLVEVSGVGWQFWTTNEYEMDNVNIFYDLKDTSTQRSRNSFTVSDVEKFNLQKSTLRFLPECQTGGVGVLEVYMNNNLVYSAVPDCGQLNLIEFSPSFIQVGDNKVIFESSKGRYLIDTISVTCKLKEMTYPLYYFDLDERFFESYGDPLDKDRKCGDIDNYCPSGCDPDLDRDCCLQKTSYFWCDRQPANQDDRCTAVVSESQCYLCPSGYEDRQGKAPEKCEKLCGDDNDNRCLPGCSHLHDKDCCFAIDKNNFWCDDVPLYGLSQCKLGITDEECDACQSGGGWDSESSFFRCDSAGSFDDKQKLKSRYRVKVRFSFLDDGERKAAKVYLNGYQFTVDTYKDEFVRYIDDYVEDGSNAIKIEPDRTILDIRKLTIEVEER